MVFEVTPGALQNILWMYILTYLLIQQDAYQRYPVPDKTEPPQPIPQPHLLCFMQDYFMLICQLEAWHLKDNSEGIME